MKFVGGEGFVDFCRRGRGFCFIIRYRIEVIKWWFRLLLGGWEFYFENWRYGKEISLSCVGVGFFFFYSRVLLDVFIYVNSNSSWY